MTNYSWDDRDLKRFYSKIPVRPDDECWLWQGTMFSTGYGAFSLQTSNRGAHRVSYEIHNGPIPPGLVIDHLCRVTRCVNPDHLEAVTFRTNNIRGMSPTHVANRNGTCLAGLHDMTDVYTRKNGIVQCRPCQVEAGRRRRREKGLKGSAQSAKTHCPAGHEYNEENTYRVPGKNHRLCRICLREKAKERYHARKNL